MITWYYRFCFNLPLLTRSARQNAANQTHGTAYLPLLALAILLVRNQMHASQFECFLWFMAMFALWRVPASRLEGWQENASAETKLALNTRFSHWRWALTVIFAGIFMALTAGLGTFRNGWHIAAEDLLVGVFFSVVFGAIMAWASSKKTLRRVHFE